MKKILLLLAFLTPFFCFGQNQSEPKKDTIITVDSNDIVERPDTSAKFIGGDAQLIQHLSAEIKYPQEARKKNIQGRVILRFLVEIDGSISNVSILRRVDPLLDEEAKRVITNMPKWTPGIHKGVPCRSYFMLPVTFKLEGVGRSK